MVGAGLWLSGNRGQRRVQGDEREMESLLEDPAGIPGPQADQGVRQVRSAGVRSRQGRVCTQGLADADKGVSWGSEAAGACG